MNNRVVDAMKRILANRKRVLGEEEYMSRLAYEVGNARRMVKLYGPDLRLKQGEPYGPVPVVR